MSADTRQEIDGQIAWFISLRETVRAGDLESAEQAIEAAITMLKEKRDTAQFPSERKV